MQVFLNLHVLLVASYVSFHRTFGSFVHHKCHEDHKRLPIDLNVVASRLDNLKKLAHQGLLVNLTQTTSNLLVIKVEDVLLILFRTVSFEISILKLLKLFHARQIVLHQLTNLANVLQNGLFRICTQLETSLKNDTWVGHTRNSLGILERLILAQISSFAGVGGVCWSHTAGGCHFSTHYL